MPPLPHSIITIRPILKRSPDFVPHPPQLKAPSTLNSWPRPSSWTKLERSDPPRENDTDSDNYLPHHHSHHNYWLAFWVGVILFKIGILTWYLQFTCPCQGICGRRRNSYQLLPNPQPSTTLTLSSSSPPSSSTSPGPFTESASASFHSLSPPWPSSL